MATKQGKQTYFLERPPSIRSYASIGGKKEQHGPMGDGFDILEPDSTFGQDSWEKAESQMVSLVVQKALQKGRLKASDIDCVFAGDLLNQCVGATFGLREMDIPFLGIYSACSTMSQGLLLAAMLIDGGGMQRAMAVTSSHFCTAERQYRFPLDYGAVRSPTTQWTATAAGAVVLEQTGNLPYVRATSVGRLTDLGVTDQNNMGAAMAPAAASTLVQFFSDTGKAPADFDLIITGDLGLVGSELLIDLAAREGLDIKSRHNDCGLMLYDRQRQDVHSGGSGCGCSAALLCSHFLPAFEKGKLHDVLFMATGALMSPLTVQQKESIPSISHLIWLSDRKDGVRHE